MFIQSLKFWNLSLISCILRVLVICSSSFSSAVHSVCSDSFYRFASSWFFTSIAHSCCCEASLQSVRRLLLVHFVLCWHLASLDRFAGSRLLRWLLRQIISEGLIFVHDGRTDGQEFQAKWPVLQNAERLTFARSLKLRRAIFEIRNYRRFEKRHRVLFVDGFEFEWLRARVSKNGQSVFWKSRGQAFCIL